MSKEKHKKTNALRILDTHHIRLMNMNGLKNEVRVFM